ncbi:MAG TPA: 4Fe-4S dicluster domain-containing protein [Candidatus Dormibacteraeota bacterium]|nr:4Fe-4S dicluster domain-containing protein [Candidatus Dormibacteraeota bacterium]
MTAEPEVGTAVTSTGATMDGPVPAADDADAAPESAEGLGTGDAVTELAAETHAPTEPGVAVPVGRALSRRTVLKLGAVALPSLVGGGAVFERLGVIAGDDAAEIDPVVARYDPVAHRWGFVVDAKSCIGCGLCVVACKQENGVPLDEEHTRTWVERHAVTADGHVHVDTRDAGMLGFAPQDPPEVPAGETITASYFVPRLCMQCEEPPCVGVCPVGATFRRPDGVVLVDEERCIGCGYCVVACPYGARYLVPAGARTPPGTAGVADKCTFCYHRITHGQVPACVEVCPVGAREFGDLDDPDSKVSRILRETPTTVIRADLGTKPRVHYIGLGGEA